MPLADFEMYSLWPSTLLVRALQDHERHDARLEELATTGPVDAVFGLDEPAVGWLKDNVIHGIGVLLGAHGVSGTPDIGVRCRLERQQLGDFEPLVNRPGAYLTGVYVLRAPRGPQALGTRDDRRPGCITFYDPRVGMNMNAIRKDPYILYHHSVQFEPGMLLLWPAFVPYFLHPHLCEEPAVRIGFDVRVGDAAAPAQAPP